MTRNSSTPNYYRYKHCVDSRQQMNKIELEIHIRIRLIEVNNENNECKLLYSI